MAENSWPSPSVPEPRYEALVSGYAADGLIGAPADPAPIYSDGSGLHYKVRAGWHANVRGYVWASDDAGDGDITKDVDPNTSGADRIDLSVLRLDRSADPWTVRVATVTGTPGAAAPAPTQQLGQAGVYEIPLGTIPVPNGTTTTIPTGAATPACWFVTPSGATTLSTGYRPPHRSGLEIWEHDTFKRYISTGSTWLLTGEDSGWVTCTVGSPKDWYVPLSQFPAVRRLNGVVQLRGGDVGINRDMSGSHSGPNFAIFSIPPGFRSPAIFYWGARSSNQIPLELAMRNSTTGEDGVVALVGYDPSKVMPTGTHVQVESTSWIPS